MDGDLELDPEVKHASPGEQVTFSLWLRNVSRRPRRFRLNLAAIDPRFELEWRSSWVVRSVPAGGRVQAELRVGFPKGAGVRPGRYRFQVTATPILPPRRPITAEGVLEVIKESPCVVFPAPKLSIAPDGTLRASLRITNCGKINISCTVTASCQDGRFRFDVDSPTVTIGVGEHIEVPVRLSPRRGVSISLPPGVSVPCRKVSIMVTPDGGAPCTQTVDAPSGGSLPRADSTAPGEEPAPPKPPPCGVLTLLGAALVSLVVVAAAWFIFRDGSGGGPQIEAVIAGTQGNNGWYRGDVVVRWEIMGSVTSSSGCIPTTISIDTTGKAVTCTAKNAGGENSKTVTIRRDATAPTPIRHSDGDKCSAQPSGGWCRGTQQASFRASDATSGVAAPCPAKAGASCTFTKPTATGGRAVIIESGPVSDEAGNIHGGTTAGPFQVDNEPPTVTCDPRPVFRLKQTRNLSVTATVRDTLSGEKRSSASADATTTKVGAFSVPITGQDIVGNSKTESCSYLVQYVFRGFLKINGNDLKEISGNDLTRAYPGDATSIGWRLLDDTGVYVNDSKAVKAVQVAPVECANQKSARDGGVGRKEKAKGNVQVARAGGQWTYTYDWTTDEGRDGKCRRFILTLDDDTEHTADFRFTGVD